jgi:hypothetical protein
VSRVLLLSRTRLLIDLLPLQLTPSEAGLLKLSSDVRAVLTAALDEPEPEQIALAFFKNQTTLIEQALEDSGRPPWEVLQIAEIALEVRAADCYRRAQ